MEIERHVTVYISLPFPNSGSVPRMDLQIDDGKSIRDRNALHKFFSIRKSTSKKVKTFVSGFREFVAVSPSKGRPIERARSHDQYKQPNTCIPVQARKGG
jgi:hypothetical protein